MKNVGLDERVIEDRSEMEEVLRIAKVGRFCLCQNDQPLITPVNFAYENGSIYFHGSDVGLKTESLRKNPNVCFEVDEFLGTVPASVPCEYDTAYRSVVAFGRAQVLTSSDEKMFPLRLIVAKYAGEETARSLTPSMVEDYRSSRGRKTAVVRIQIDRMTGKRSINRSQADSD
jgi:nitroimidazol reductase NimA-like FMN-containing flavoprotein (pyridoxamine 5'-phosphate oxidase superfamily)